jgi:hypothetical protein
MDKMGKRSPFLTGKHKFPSLRDWDVKTANQDLQKVHDLMGLKHGLTTGSNDYIAPMKVHFRCVLIQILVPYLR